VIFFGKQNDQAIKPKLLKDQKQNKSPVTKNCFHFPKANYCWNL